eukprot:Gb_27539 [translate_table: standard]
MKGGTEQDDEEFEMLLGEIPSATSAPQHLEEVQIANESPKDEGISHRVHDRKSSTMDTYGKFYQGYHAVKNLSSSSGGNIVSLSPNSSNSFPAFYGTLSFDASGCGSSSQLQVEQRSQLQGTLCQEMNTEQEQHQPNLTAHQNGVALSTQQIFPDDQSLTTAFANLSLKEATVLNQAVHAAGKYGDRGFGNPVLADGQDPRCAVKAYSAFDVVSASVPGHLNGMVSLSSPSSLSPASSSNMYGIKCLSQHWNLNGDFQATVDEISIPGMKKVFKYNAYGPNAYGNNLGFSLEDFTVEPMEPQRPFPVYSAAAPPIPEMQGFQVVPSASISGAEILSPLSGMPQPYYLDSQVGSYLQPQHCPPAVPAFQHPLNRMHWQHVEEERCKRMHQQYILLQQVQTQQLAGLPNQVGAGTMGSSLNRSIRQQVVQPSMTISAQVDQPFYKYQQQGVPSVEGDWSTHLVPGIASASALNISEFPMQSGNVCRYYAQGFCGRGESCPFSHGQMQAATSDRISPSGSVMAKDPSMVVTLNGEEKAVFPEKILTRNRSRGVNSVRTINLAPPGGRKDSLSNGSGSGKTLSNGHHSALRVGSFQLDNQGHSRELSPEIADFELTPRTLSSSQQQLPKYTSLEEVEGRIYFIARDQHGCRFLQRKFDEGSPEDVQKIFVEIIDHIIELMTDPFGNYLVQKLLEVCNEEQRMQILHAITGKPGELVNISLNMHGTRAVQKMIETLKTPQQVSMVIFSLKPGVVTLIKDLNGNHVVQRCLQCLVNEDSQEQNFDVLQDLHTYCSCVQDFVTCEVASRRALNTSKLSEPEPKEARHMPVLPQMEEPWKGNHFP